MLCQHYAKTNIEFRLLHNSTTLIHQIIKLKWKSFSSLSRSSCFFINLDGNLRFLGNKNENFLKRQSRTCLHQRKNQHGFSLVFHTVYRWCMGWYFISYVYLRIILMGLTAHTWKDIPSLSQKGFWLIALWNYFAEKK